MAVATKSRIRSDVASLSTGRLAGYYDSKGHFLHTLSQCLADYGYHLDSAELMDLIGDEGRKNLSVIKDDSGPSAIDYFAVCSWYAMPSGRIEFTVYLS